MGYQEWRTPPAFFAALDAEFHFTIDVAASDQDHLCSRYYTKEQDGLRQPWAGEVVWCNPPYGNVYPWVEKACQEAAFHGATCVLLLNPCTDTAWFHNFIWDDRLHRPRSGVEVRLLPGRIRFLDQYGLPGPSPRHPNMLAVFRRASVAHLDVSGGLPLHQGDCRNIVKIS